MRILIRFMDNEVFEADSDSVDPTNLVFVVRPLSGNNQLAWVSLAFVKYISFPETETDASDMDPRALRAKTKVVLRFKDGEVLHAYKDDAFGQEGHGFNVRLLDPKTERLVRAVVSAHALKAVFFVQEWDSRQPQERHSLVSPRLSRTK